uniref:(S)-2-hydroxy-acid oxidase n=2 Tax=Diabrotica virgifera virgifera TaxID=50390 RepID=A0A6P7GPK1_DIAVI
MITKSMHKITYQICILSTIMVELGKKELWNGTKYIIASRYRIKPKYMRTIRTRNLSTTILGKPVAFPIGISPTACQKLAHFEGECATAKAAQDLETIFILSSHSNSSFEELAKAAPHGKRWLQMYLFQNREMTKEFAKLAEANGFEALVITIDYTMPGLRRHMLRNEFVLPPYAKYVLLERYHERNVISAVVNISDPDADWSYVRWLTTITKLPIVIKGILTAEDAVAAADVGASAILVSNHGGRQLDSIPSTIEALPEVVKAVGHRVEIYMDGGIRDGTDVYKALSLGARMVFIGRPAIWGLVHGGSEGVKSILKILQEELDNAMCLTGCSVISNLDQERVVHESYYARL